MTQPIAKPIARPVARRYVTLDDFALHPEWPEFWQAWQACNPPGQRLSGGLSDEAIALEDFSRQIRDAEQARERAEREAVRRPPPRPPAPPAKLPQIEPSTETFDLDTADGRRAYNCDFLAVTMQNVCAELGHGPTQILAVVAAVIADTMEAQRALRVALEERVAVLESRPASEPPASDPRIAELELHCEALTKRLADIEARPTLKFCGRWEEGEYQAGSVVEHGGSMWITTVRTTQKPTSGDAWQLAVRRGRDGKSRNVEL